MKAELARPVAVQEEPIFHVRLWTPPVEEGFAWFVDEWELTECDVIEALEWAKQQSGDNPFELSVRAAAFPDFYQLYGYPADGGGIQETVFLHTDSPT
jgi:hypothetical protein